jgi:hypothetical protein
MSAKRRNRLSEAAPIFAALGDETRLRLIARLSTDGPLSIARLTAGARDSPRAHAQDVKECGSSNGGRSMPRANVWMEFRRNGIARSRVYGSSWKSSFANMQRLLLHNRARTD